ncbi:ThuA domain-containing protein [Salsipaludibacter albus]|uniref:ThuA domain-containing protein n=1 Tax=Salsipaludibacter albus TaxID=2849650 RepID=UPI001EE3E037|nr:ThuA domain-containing protein [Salsipaludibacter albus]MBY5162218.1 ThuA domain-containing protein [Salsipaludibacter albus]
MNDATLRHPIPLVMRRLLIAVVAATLLATVFAVAPPPAQAQAEDYEVLVVGKTLGFRHSHIDETTNAIIALGEEHGFTVDVWDNRQPALTLATTPFTSAEDLAKYATIVFVSPVDGTNNLNNPTRPRLLNDDEAAALQGYIRAGGGFVGLHAATDAMHTYPWYSELTGGGARFRNHPAQQTATMRVEDPTHPSTEMLPLAWERFDEWYNFTTNPREDVHVLITLDESTYNPGFGAMGADHPLAWCHNFEGGRSWYEAAGHVEAAYVDPTYLAHMLGGIEWTAGVVGDAGDCRTFNEVDAMLASVDAGSRPAQVLVPKIQARLDAAHAAELALDHATSAEFLESAQGMAHAVDTDLAHALADLWTWQEAATAATAGTP